MARTELESLPVMTRDRAFQTGSISIVPRFSGLYFLTGNQWVTSRTLGREKCLVGVQDPEQHPPPASCLLVTAFLVKVK